MSTPPVARDQGARISAGHYGMEFVPGAARITVETDKGKFPAYLIHSEDPTTVEQLKAGGHQEYTVGGQSVYMLPYHHRRAFPDARGYVHAEKTPTESHARRSANGDFVRQPGRSLDNVVGGGKKKEQPSRAHFIRFDKPMVIKAGEKEVPVDPKMTPKQREDFEAFKAALGEAGKILNPPQPKTYGK